MPEVEEKLEGEQEGDLLTDELLGEESLGGEELQPESWLSGTSVLPTGETFEPAVPDGQVVVPEIDGAERPFYSEQVGPPVLQQASMVAYEPVQERSELIAEVAKVEALLEQMQAIRHANANAERLSSPAEYLSGGAMPYLMQRGSTPVEYAPAVETAEAKVAVTDVAAEAETPAPEAAPEANSEAGVLTLLESAEHTPVAAEPVREEVPPGPEPIAMQAVEETTLAAMPAEVKTELPSGPPAAASLDAAPLAEAPASASEGIHEAERIHRAVERVFDRFRPLLVAAIVRELAKRD
jgi:hypothetical protein